MGTSGCCHHDVVSSLHDTEINFLIRQYRYYTIFDVDDDLLVLFCGRYSPSSYLTVIGFFTPHRRRGGVDMQSDAITISFRI